MIKSTTISPLRWVKLNDKKKQGLEFKVEYVYRIILAYYNWEARSVSLFVWLGLDLMKSNYDLC